MLIWPSQKSRHHDILSKLRNKFAQRPYPMLPIDVLVGIPLPGQEWISFGYYLSIEERRERWKFARKSSDFQVSAEVTILFVDVLKRNVKRC